MRSTWQPDFFRTHTIYAPFASAAEQLASQPEWPDTLLYNDLARHYGVRNSRGQDICFAPAAPKRRRRRRQSKLGKPILPIPYETEVYEQARVPTRPRHWHDFFNMLVWCAFPRIKAALNERQVLSRQETDDPLIRSGRARSFEQNRLTMFDEGGVLIACSEACRPELLEWLSRHQVGCDAKIMAGCSESWRQLARSGAEALMVGHAILEATQTGHWELTAMAHIVLVPDNYFELSLVSRWQMIDQQVAEALRIDRLMAEKGIFPGFPVVSLQ